jgi:N-acetyltransferase
MQTLALDRAFFNVTMTMILQPTLEGEILFLRPTTAEDREPLFTVASDREIWAIHPMHNRWQRPVFDAFFDDGLASGGALTVIDKSSGKIIGSSRYGRDLATSDAIEIGWTYLARSHWGGRYNAEMKRLMIVHALQFFDTICFLVGESNFRSRRAMEKIGALLTDRKYDTIAADEVLITHVIYEINADSFENSSLSARN